MGACKTYNNPGTRLAPTQGRSWAGIAQAEPTPRGSGQVADKTETGHSCSLPSCSELLPRGVPDTAWGPKTGVGGERRQERDLNRGTRKEQGPFQCPGVQGTVGEGRAQAGQLTQHERTHEGPWSG